MSSDTANLLREHVKATADLLTNAKPDKEEKSDVEPTLRNGGGGSAAGSQERGKPSR